MDRRMSDLLTECDQFVRDIPITLFERRSHAPAKNPCLTKYHCLISVEIKREVAEIRYVQRGLYGLTRRCLQLDSARFDQYFWSKLYRHDSRMRRFAENNLPIQLARGCVVRHGKRKAMNRVIVAGGPERELFGANYDPWLNQIYR